MENEANGHEEEVRPSEEQETEGDRRDHGAGEGHVDVGDDFHIHDLVSRQHQRSRWRKARSHSTNLIFAAWQRTETQARARSELFLFNRAIWVDQLDRRTDRKAEKGIARSEVDKEEAQLNRPIRFVGREVSLLGAVDHIRAADRDALERMVDLLVDGSGLRWDDPAPGQHVLDGVFALLECVTNARTALEG